MLTTYGSTHHLNFSFQQLRIVYYTDLPLIVGLRCLDTNSNIS